MPIALDKIIWITDKAGVVLEEYKDKFSLKAVQKYQSQGDEKVSYDWVFKEKWNPDTRKREMPSKANCAQGVYLGDIEQTIRTLTSILRSFKDGTATKEEDDGVPF